MVSSYLDKIVLISRESKIREPLPDRPYMCVFDVFDTSPSSETKGARIANIQFPMEISTINIKVEPDGKSVNLTLFSPEAQASCILSADLYDPRSVIKQSMKALNCYIDYPKIDKILEHVRKKVDL